MLTINKSTCTLNLSGQPGLTTEASDIGLRPGEWPEMISVIDDGAEGFLFFRSRELTYGSGEDREFCGIEYQTKGGAYRLTVFND